MLTLNNVACQDDYDETTSLGPIPEGQVVNYLIANNAAIVQLAGYSPDKTIQPFGPELLMAPSSGSFQRTTGIRFRNAVPGSVARVIAQLIQPDDPLPIGSTPFSDALSAGGGITPGGGNMLTGRVSALGVILGGTGFTVAHPSAGTYTVTFATPFTSTPVVLVDVDVGGGGNFHSHPDNITVNGFSVFTGTSVGGGVDQIFNFIAVEMA